MESMGFILKSHYYLYKGQTTELQAYDLDSYLGKHYIIKAKQWLCWFDLIDHILNLLYQANLFNLFSPTFRERICLSNSFVIA